MDNKKYRRKAEEIKISWKRNEKLENEKRRMRCLQMKESEQHENGRDNYRKYMRFGFYESLINTFVNYPLFPWIMGHNVLT